MIAFLLAALLALPAQAQEQGQFNSACFLGLVDAQTPATLGNCESPALLNVESNLDGTAILKRKGFSKTADLTIATAPVNGSHSFIDSSGNRLDIVCQDTRCLKSTNGNAFAAFLTTAAAGITRWSFADQGGILYGANNKRDPIMKYDGTTRTSPVGMPLGSILALTQDRLAIGDISALPNRVHYSSAGAYEQFTIGVNPEDSFFDDFGADGDRVRGIKCIHGNCFIFKTASITVCEMADQYNTQCSVISPNVGTTDPASIVAAGSELYFRAQDNNYWKIGRGGLEQISRKIPNLVKSQSGGLGGGENTNTQTTAADWNAGYQNPSASWNTTTTNGSVFPSSVTIVDTSSVNFAAGTLTNLSANDNHGDLRLSSTTFQDNFADGNFTSAPTWTDPSGNFTISGGALVNSIGSGSIYVAQSNSTGSFSFQTAAFPNSGHMSETKFISAGNTLSGSNGYSLSVEHGGSTTVNLALKKWPSGATIGSVSFAPINGPDSLNTYIVQRNQSGNFLVYEGSTSTAIRISATDTDYSTSTYMVSSCIAGNCMWGNFYFVSYSSAGSAVSRIFDTGFSTPTGGTFAVSTSAPSGTALTYSLRSSSSPNNDFWGAWSAATNGSRITQVLRYWQYAPVFTTQYSTVTPIISEAALIAATTGQFTTQCIQPNASITAWGTLSCAQTLSGNGSLVYYATSAVTCAALPTSTAPVNAQGAAQAGWTQQTNNATVTIATNTAVFIGWRSLLGSATDQAQVDACVLSWNEGTPAQPSWAAYDSIKNAVYFTATTNGAAATNRLLKYDRNLEQWYPFDIAAQAPRFINNELYFGGAAAGTWSRYGLVDSDDGASINAYYTTKDVGSDAPFQEKDFKTLSILSRNQGTGTMLGTWTNSIGNTGSYTISLSTGTGISYARSNYNLPKKSPQNFMKIRIGNDSSTPFEILGLGLTWAVLPWKVAP